MSAVLLARPGDDVREIVSLARGGEPILSRVNLTHARRVIDAQDSIREFAPAAPETQTP